MKEGEEISKRKSMAHRHRKHCGDILREEGGKSWVEVGKVGGNGDICNSVNNKNKDKWRRLNVEDGG